MFEAISSSEFRKNLRGVFEKICRDHVTVIATRAKGENIVMMSESDYHALNETAYLLSRPTNKARLSAALKDKGTTYDTLGDIEDALGI